MTIEQLSDILDCIDKEMLIKVNCDTNILGVSIVNDEDGYPCAYLEFYNERRIINENT